MKTIGVVISTPGRRSLARTLHSIAYQQAPIEDVLVVGDGYHAATAELVREFADGLGLPCRYEATEKTRNFGHSQMNYGLQRVRGDYVTVQDDDDIYLPRALTEMALLIERQEEPHPIIGRVKTPNWGLLWQRPNPSSVLDGHCMVAPNDKKRLGYYCLDYNGDQAYIHTCIRPYVHLDWVDRVWTLTRPEWRMWPAVIRQSESEWVCNLHRDDDGVPAIDPAFTVSLRFEEERAWLAVDERTVDDSTTINELEEAVQFAVFACQSRHCWIRIPSGEIFLKEALLASQFKIHEETSSYVELTHDWPPYFWAPVSTIFQMHDQNGEPLQDYRDDVWGWRPRHG